MKDMEELLREMALVDSPRRLDTRVGRLLDRRRNWAWAAAAGFAAGVGVMIPVALSAARHPAGATTTPVMQVRPAPQEQTRLVLLAQPHESVERIEGEINGVPVIIARTHRELALTAADPAQAGWNSVVALPDGATEISVQNK